MRLKHILLPLFAITLLGAYSGYSQLQQSKFDSNIWKMAIYDDVSETRTLMLSPLMAHVLKVGMSIEEVDSLLGVPHEERRIGACLWLDDFRIRRIYVIEKEDSEDLELVMDFSLAMNNKLKMTNYYISGYVRPLLF